MNAAAAETQDVKPPAWMDDWLELLSDREKSRVRYREVGEWFIAVVPFMFTSGIIKGYRWAHGRYEDRWCFETLEKANSAFDAWEGMIGEPFGWHRHPNTGRCRTNGDPAQEYVNL
jgi:hypothetical protein